MEEKDELQRVKEAQDLCDKKAKSWKAQREICVATAKQVKIDKMHLYKYKDMKYYYGRGWTETAISKPDSTEKFKDRVSPCFRRLLEIVNILREVGDHYLLQEYLSALEDEGIEINIDWDHVTETPVLMGQSKELVKQAVEDMCKLQRGICESADNIRELGPTAEAEGLCPAGRFKGLAEDYYKMSVKPEAVEKVVDRRTKDLSKNLLDNHGIEMLIGKSEE